MYLCVCEDHHAAACAVRGTCYRAGKCCANSFPRSCWEVSPPFPPWAVPSWVPPSALYQTTLFSFQQGLGSFVHQHCQAGVRLASTYLLSIPVRFVFSSLWRWLENKTQSPLPPSPGCRAFPSPLSSVSFCLSALCVSSAPDAHHVVVAF